MRGGPTSRAPARGPARRRSRPVTTRALLWRSRLAAALAVGLLAAACAERRPPPAPPAPHRPRPERRAPRTVAAVLARYGDEVDARLRPLFERARAPYPPASISLLAFKEERKVELWAPRGSGHEAFVRSYPILAASGDSGPKLREGDLQVPEGIYRILWLNPTSHYHLSMKIDYPNDFDREMAARDGRSDLGGDIFLHGENLSIGCIAVGDRSIEELFVLAARVGVGHVRLIIAPRDLRKRQPPRSSEPHVAWLPELYARIRRALAPYQLPS